MSNFKKYQFNMTSCLSNKNIKLLQGGSNETIGSIIEATIMGLFIASIPIVLSIVWR